jgi:MFS transporter, MFS domain-containing protein family, molybdate-anion transporter
MGLTVFLFVMSSLWSLNPAVAFSSASRRNQWSNQRIDLGVSANTPTLYNDQRRHKATCQHSRRIVTDGIQYRASVLGALTVNKIPRGGDGKALSAAIPSFSHLATAVVQSPQSLFNTALVSLGVFIAVIKFAPRVKRASVASSGKGGEVSEVTPQPAVITSLQRRFLAVFWLLRGADWLQGPYFYEVYASKIVNGATASMALVSQLFLTGFASTALFGPSVGRAADTYGRKRATLAFTILYGLGALSTKSPLLAVLFIGRILSGIGTSLLFSAPEAWLVGEAQKSGADPTGKYLGQTFGYAYAGDSIVAILAGQLATSAASRRGPTGPFELSTLLLAAGGILAASLWKENRAENADGEDSKPSIAEAIQYVREDPKIMLVGAVQSLFEAAMYIFVLQWPPTLFRAINTFFSGQTVATPYGTIFSCFMACCLLGSTLFGILAQKGVGTETSAVGMLGVSTLAMSAATAFTWRGQSVSLPGIVAAFFIFEACVGMYFPSIGTLRSKYVPDSHRSVIMNLFGIPLNVLVVSVFLSIQKLGVHGALSISSGALAIATLCMYALQARSSKVKQSGTS